MVVKWEREAEWSVCCGKRQFRRTEGCEEWVDVGGLLATWDHGDIQAWAAASCHIGVRYRGSVLLSMIHVATKVMGVLGV